MSTHITGTLILAGDYAMQIDDNEPLARVVIVMPLADLNAVEMLPMNQDVTVIRSDELAQLRAELKKECEQSSLQLAACDCAAMMDTAETHEQNKTVTRLSGSPAWSPAFDSVMRRTAECIRLRAELAAVRNLMREVKAHHAEGMELMKGANAEIEKLEAELAAARERTAHFTVEEVYGALSDENRRFTTRENVSAVIGAMSDLAHIDAARAKEGKT